MVDLGFIILALPFLLPLFVIIAVLIKSSSHGPILFTQTRVGYKEIPFTLFKFRTMYMDSEKEGLITVGDDNRITNIGKWLRKYKLDELPQLFNVLKGEMSLVGPRPQVPAHIAFVTEESKKLIFSTLPGITDPSSIMFKNESEILGKVSDPETMYITEILPQKIKGYENYVCTRSLHSDIKIIFQTLRAIISN